MSRSKISAYIRLMRADKPIGIYLLLWPTLWALVIVSQAQPPLDVLVVFVLGVIVMRSAGCVINDYADRHVDGSVERTKARPIVSGEVSEREALGLFVGLLIIALLLVLTLNVQTIILSFGALLLATVYPFMKRYTHFPQVVLGAAFSWSIPMAFMAVSGEVPWIAWVLYSANLLWTVAYDTQYAMVDRDDDLRIGVKSTAILFGPMDKLIIGFLQLVTLGLLFLIAKVMMLSWPFYVSLVVSAILFGYQQFLIHERDKTKCFKSFLNNHYVGMVITIGLVCHYLI
ncbi:4-hydroxybenzoate octaprenyltransferase [Aliiglaciecola sp. M165]|uniref:4-hydroxybenzoate octaprenyltransferase n=1 Tax=Aliiglaciecola sp. M165 TaxID=2593649 RepID=UPI00117E3EBC|nr:4-hydroxybenzoate octaprenyltransferase [Aliiglaciecola sp. M165]TRY34055.1 4-hydroxybenzoate octaprenyltransferase [Aliiglaciecola sp. M165]